MRPAAPVANRAPLQANAFNPLPLGQRDAEGVAARSVAPAGQGTQRPSRRVLARPRTAERVARRRRRRLGARPIFPRWPGPAGLPHEGPGADRQGQKVDGLDALESAPRRRHRSCQEYRLVAELRHAQGAGAIPGGLRRRARDSPDGEVFRLPGGAPGRAPAQRVGHLPLARRSAQRALALQPQRRPRAARSRPQAAPAGPRLGGAVRQFQDHRAGAARRRPTSPPTASTTPWR